MEAVPQGQSQRLWQMASRWLVELCCCLTKFYIQDSPLGHQNVTSFGIRVLRMELVPLRIVKKSLSKWVMRLGTHEQGHPGG